MALKFLEGFELSQHKTYSERSFRYVYGTPTYSKPGRVSGYSVSWGTSSGPRFDTNPLSSGYSNNWVMGFGFKADTILSSGSMTDYTGFRFERGSGNSQVILYIEREDDDTVRWILRRGDSVSTGSVIASSTPFDPRSWRYFELKISITTSGGSAEMRMHDAYGNTSTILSASSLNSAYQGSDGADIVRIQARSYPTFIGYLDDIYIEEGSDYLGPIVIEGILPNATGVYEEWNDSPSSSNYANVDDSETSPSTSEYVFDDGTSSPLARDLYGYEDPSFVKGDIVGIEIETAACLDVASGSESFHHLLRSGSGAESTGSSITVTTNVIESSREVFEQDPASSSSWTDSGLSDYTWGIERE